MAHLALLEKADPSTTILHLNFTVQYKYQASHICNSRFPSSHLKKKKKKKESGGINFDNVFYLAQYGQSTAYPGVTVIKNLPANERDPRDVGSVPGLGRSPGKRNGNPLQYSWLGNPMDRGTWKATAYGLQRVRHD